MRSVEMAVAVAQQNAENDRKVSSEYLIQKAWRVAHSCKTAEQAKFAMIYLDLMAEQYPQMDISPMKAELRTLFDGAI